MTGKAGDILRDEIQRSIQETIEMGEERLNEILRPGPMGVFKSVVEAGKGKVSRGNYRRNIHSQVRGLRGLIQDSNLVYGPWLEGTSSRNQTTGFKGYASFRTTREWLETMKRGIQEKMVRRIVRRLGGK